MKVSSCPPLSLFYKSRCQIPHACINVWKDTRSVLIIYDLDWNIMEDSIHILVFTEFALILAIQNVNRSFILKLHTGSCVILFHCVWHFWVIFSGCPYRCSCTFVRILRADSVCTMDAWCFVRPALWQPCSWGMHPLKHSGPTSCCSLEHIRWDHTTSRVSFCAITGIPELREASWKEYTRERNGDVSDVKRRSAIYYCLFVFFLSSFAIWSDLISREMQSLPERCVAPQLQPTGLYRRNQFVRVVHEKQNIQREPRDWNGSR